MKTTSITLALFTLIFPQLHAYSAKTPADDNAPALYQSGMPTTDAELEAALGIPPGMQAPALKRYFIIVMNNKRPTPADYQNLVNEYNSFMVKYRNIWLMYNQMIQAGNYPAAMQLSDAFHRLTMMYSYYDAFINQYKIDQTITQ